jgi:hypothetical protein
MGTYIPGNRMRCPRTSLRLVSEQAQGSSSPRPAADDRPEPATTQPATTEPATTQPATTEPATTRPAPATTEPAADGPAQAAGPEPAGPMTARRVGFALASIWRRSTVRNWRTPVPDQGDEHA